MAYLLDADVFIRPKNLHYELEPPGFYDLRSLYIL